MGFLERLDKFSSKRDQRNSWAIEVGVSCFEGPTDHPGVIFGVKNLLQKDPSR